MRGETAASAADVRAVRCGALIAETLGVVVVMCQE